MKNEENSRIVDELYRKREIQRIVHSFCRDEFADDLIQDICLQLLESESTAELYRKNELKYYIVGIARKSVNSTSSSFYSKYKKFRKATEPYEKEQKVC